MCVIIASFIDYTYRKFAYFFLFVASKMKLSRLYTSMHACMLVQSGHSEIVEGADVLLTVDYEFTNVDLRR